MKRWLSVTAIALLMPVACVSVSVSVSERAGATIVGAWVVKYDKAPFPFHMQTFNADGTMQQANPDAGSATTSDSDGMGVWVAKDDHVRGKWVEIRADRATHAHVGRGEITFDVKVNGNAFSGMAQATFYGPDGKLTDGPIDTPVSGERVTLP